MVQQSINGKLELSMNYVNSDMALLNFGDNEIEDSCDLVYEVDNET
jgi:hypothetical protein